MMLFADDAMTGSEIALIITAVCGGVATLITAIGSVIAAVYMVKLKLLAEQAAVGLAQNTSMTKDIRTEATLAVVDVKAGIAQVAANQLITHQAIANLAEQPAAPATSNLDGIPVVTAPAIVLPPKS